MEINLFFNLFLEAEKQVTGSCNCINSIHAANELYFSSTLLWAYFGNMFTELHKVHSEK